MRRLKSTLAACAALAALVGLVTVATPTTGRGQGGVGNPKDVNVVNTPAVTAQQGGPWSVSLAGTPSVGLADNTVRVGNTEASPVPARTLDDSLRQVKQFGRFVELPAGDVVESAVAYDVPAGRRLVVEHVSVNLAEAQGAVVTNLWFETTAGGALVQHLVPLPYAGSGMAGGPARFYADGGTEVRVLMRVRDPLPADARAFFSFSGYLVDEP